MKEKIKWLTFGTGGLRGVLGEESDQMNENTIRKATQGLSDYLNGQKAGAQVAIAYDSRLCSETFAKTAARVLADNGIKVWIYRELMPTPSLSFAVRHLHCDMGICITASHNPSKYNGYKVYGADGCQITEAAVEKISACMDAVDLYADRVYPSFEESMEAGKIAYIPEETVTAFLDAIQSYSLREPLTSGLKIVYTPLNGAGRKCVLSILERIGAKEVTVVKEQELPDGNFPTCPYPNPEIPEALTLGLDLCRETGAHLLLATDPDSDRVGVAVRHEGDYVLLTGNQVGMLLLDYILKKRKAQNRMPENPVIVKTIVTSSMIEKIAEANGMQVINTLTGFKYIGEQIGLLEAKGEEERYVFGLEESCGYLPGGFVRDKDAVSACMLTAEMADEYLEEGKTLVDVLQSFYETFGYYENKLVSFSYEGKDAMERMQAVMTRLKESGITELAGHIVVESLDYSKGIKGLPKSNVLEYNLDNGAKVIVRPSGTEPKMKLYLETKEAAPGASFLKELEAYVVEHVLN